ncbi:MAG: glutamine synthetase family protein [Lachnospiraceae bacterium]|nr:glutamine synthetase family protein [Lachnospiraceae bacterium]
MKTKEEILNLIEEEGVEFIRLQFTDMFGNLKNLAVTPSQIDKVLENRYVLDEPAMFGTFKNCVRDMYLYPVTESFKILPWRPKQGKVGRFICDVCYEDGTPCEMSPRSILKNVLDTASKEGYDFYVDPEIEFFLFRTDENGSPTVVSYEDAGYMDVGPADNGENARRDMVLALEEMGFEIKSSWHEKASAQHEIDYTGGEALQIADSIMTFRFAVRSIAKNFGLYATFMPKPKNDVPGSGLHLNFAVYKKDKSIFKISQKKDGTIEISDEAKWFMGGIMKHARAVCCFTNPIINSYKRLSNGFEAPGSVGWTTTGDNSFLRIHKYSGEETKIELRFPDPSANPYLAFAAVISAGLDGIRNRISPGLDIVNDNSVVSDNKALPKSLNDSVEAAGSDELLSAALGDEFLRLYLENKQKEWSEYMHHVSDWEIDRYLSRL